MGSRLIGTDDESELDGHLLVNLKTTYEISSHLSVTAAVDNLFDTLYEIRPYSCNANAVTRFLLRQSIDLRDNKMENIPTTLPITVNSDSGACPKP
ncbi:MAG: TonB-dependent receptor [Spirochaetaceae bacterium]|nr:TonB-dependent receptor [Spirochaetaceae bacterium]